MMVSIFGVQEPAPAILGSEKPDSKQLDFTALFCQELSKSWD